MPEILTLKQTDFEPQAPEVDRANFFHRQAARAVVLDTLGQVGLMHVSSEGYYKLPGGGIDEGEDKEQALKREILEELGCEVAISKEIGEVLEYRDYWRMIQLSFCYLAHVVGEKGSPELTELELSQGFTVTWQANIAAAIETLQSQRPIGKEEPIAYKFMQARDIAILEAAQKVVEK